MSLSDIVRSFSSLRILVVGDVCIDRFLYARRSQRANPEADGGILEVYDAKESPGMAGLVVACVDALGATAKFGAPFGRSPEKTRRCLHSLDRSVSYVAAGRWRF